MEKRYTYGREIYYKIYLTKNDKLTIIEMQDVDEQDYDSKRFYKIDDQDIKFESEREAIGYLNDNFNLNYIDEKYRTPNHPIFLKPKT